MRFGQAALISCLSIGVQPACALVSPSVVERSSTRPISTELSYAAKYSGSNFREQFHSLAPIPRRSAIVPYWSSKNSEFRSDYRDQFYSRIPRFATVVPHEPDAPVTKEDDEKSNSAKDWFADGRAAALKFKEEELLSEIHGASASSSLRDDDGVEDVRNKDWLESGRAAALRLKEELEQNEPPSSSVPVVSLESGKNGTDRRDLAEVAKKEEGLNRALLTARLRNEFSNKYHSRKGPPSGAIQVNEAAKEEDSKFKESEDAARLLDEARTAMEEAKRKKADLLATVNEARKRKEEVKAALEARKEEVEEPTLAREDGHFIDQRKKTKEVEVVAKAGDDDDAQVQLREAADLVKVRAKRITTKAPFWAGATHNDVSSVLLKALSPVINVEEKDDALGCVVAHLIKGAVSGGKAALFAADAIAETMTNRDVLSVLIASYQTTVLATKWASQTSQAGDVTGAMKSFATALNSAGIASGALLHGLGSAEASKSAGMALVETSQNVMTALSAVTSLGVKQIVRAKNNAEEMKAQRAAEAKAEEQRKRVEEERVAAEKKALEELARRTEEEKRKVEDMTKAAEKIAIDRIRREAEARNAKLDRAYSDAVGNIKQSKEMHFLKS